MDLQQNVIRASLFSSGAPSPQKVALSSGSEVSLAIKFSKVVGGSEPPLVQKLIRSEHPLAVLYLLKLGNEPFANFKLESESVRLCILCSGWRGNHCYCFLVRTSTAGQWKIMILEFHQQFFPRDQKSIVILRFPTQIERDWLRQCMI